MVVVGRVQVFGIRKKIVWRNIDVKLQIREENSLSALSVFNVTWNILFEKINNG